MNIKNIFYIFCIIVNISLFFEINIFLNAIKENKAKKEIQNIRKKFRKYDKISKKCFNNRIV